MPYWAMWVLLWAGESAGNPGRVDIQLLRVMYEMDIEGGEGCKPCSNVWEAHKIYYRRAVKKANISVQI